jgi:CheY-like chemotaxis protein
MRVLVVDDEKNIRRTFSLALESMNHEVSTAATGKEAIDRLKQASFDVAFLDLKLSQESGLDVLKGIVRASPQTFVVIVTAFAREYGITHIVLGRPGRRNLFHRFQASIYDRILDELPEVDLVVV